MGAVGSNDHCDRCRNASINVIHHDPCCIATLVSCANGAELGDVEKAESEEANDPAGIKCKDIRAHQNSTERNGKKRDPHAHHFVDHHLAGVVILGSGRVGLGRFQTQILGDDSCPGQQDGAADEVQEPSHWQGSQRAPSARRGFQQPGIKESCNQLGGRFLHPLNP